MSDHISASQIKTFDGCPKEYYLGYVEELESTKGDNKYLRLGSRVHDTIEMVLQDNPEIIESPDMLKGTLTTYYDGMSGPEYDLEQDEYQRGRKCVEKAAEYLGSQQPEIRTVEAFNKYWLDAPTAKAQVYGKMDIATETEIWDWKTGKVRKSTSEKEKIQGSIYMGAYLEEFGEPPEAVKFIYLSPHATDDGAVVRTVDATDENWDFMIEKATALLDAMEDGRFPANPNANCYFCDYELFCGDSEVGVENVPVDEY